ncbi:MAG: hypothetical protein IJM19_00215 [Ruminococcus sp.]|nr:hypothetical protein [Ruminococcus sp.]
MKDIQKIMRLDFLTAKPSAMPVFVFVVLLCFGMSLFFAPLLCAYIIFGAMVFVIPLQGIADKNGFNKLYGMIPVRRKNITRARFLYIFLVHFITEIIEIILALISINLKLYRLLPNQDGEMLQMIEDSFNDNHLTFTIIIGMFGFFCFCFSYMEMMGQIFGRENEMKILTISISVFVGFTVGFLQLSEHGIIPIFLLPSMPSSISGKIILAVSGNVLNFIICTVFGEITANKLSKREL